MMWLSLSLELLYVGLLLISCTLLSMQLCIRAWFPSTQRCGQLLNAFAAVFTVLGGLLGMVGHMMFMQVFQTTVSMGPEDFKPHSYGYSWAFYVAWFAFTVCMSAGVSTLNNYTKNVLMVGARLNSSLNPFNFVGLLPPAPYFSAPNSGMARAFHQSHAPISHLSPYYEQPPSKSPPPPSPDKSLSCYHPEAHLPLDFMQGRLYLEVRMQLHTATTCLSTKGMAMFSKNPVGAGHVSLTACNAVMPLTPQQ